MKIFHLDANNDCPFTLVVAEDERSVTKRDFKASSFNLDGLKVKCGSD